MAEECAIPMCGSEEQGPMAPVCENGHAMHRECLAALAKSALLCPMCRSESLAAMANTAAPPLPALHRTPFTQFGASAAYLLGVVEQKEWRSSSSAAR